MKYGNFSLIMYCQNNQKWAFSINIKHFKLEKIILPIKYFIFLDWKKYNTKDFILFICNYLYSFCLALFLRLCLILSLGTRSSITSFCLIFWFCLYFQVLGKTLHFPTWRCDLMWEMSYGTQKHISLCSPELYALGVPTMWAEWACLFW